MRNLILLVLLVFSATGQTFQAYPAGDLNTSWSCDDPACPMLCRPKCEPLNCTVTCDIGFTCSQTPSCQVDCPYNSAGILVSMSCPTCSSSCAPLICQNCTNTCDPVNCSWECFLPTTCQYPKCELVASAPACQASWAMRLNLSNTFLLLMFIITVLWS